MSDRSTMASGLIVHSTHPFNAEPPLGRLRVSFVTCADDLYVRSHGDVPELDAAAHRVRVSGQVERPLSLTVDELRDRYPSRTVLAVLQCAGNRRADLQRVEPTSGDPWSAGAIGNVEWTGTPLVEVLRSAGARVDAHLHVAFTGADLARIEGAPDAPYEVSIPMGKALCPDVLLAWGMNGASLRPEHGAPLRLVVPGYAGVRSAKWLARIRVQARPSPAFHQAHDYLLYPPHVRKGTQDGATGVTIDEMPINSAICEPAADASVAAGKVAVRGYATATDRAIARVDVSPDGGRSWHQAMIEPHGGARWSWVFWTAELDLPPGRHELAVRAWDAAGQTQPAALDDCWNFKGYLCTAWHRVQVVAE